MVKVWYMDMADSTNDPREDLTCRPDRPLSVDELFQKTGVEYFYFPLDPAQEYTEPSKLMAIRHTRGVLFGDEVDIQPSKLPNYRQQKRNFLTQHLHADEEIRYCLAGSGYFDVGDNNDNWIRIELNPGDLIIVPAGLYHRFTLDKHNYLKAKRYYTEGPHNIPHNRPQDDLPARLQYIQRFLVQS